MSQAIVFKCKICNVRLSNEVRELTDPALIQKGDEMDYLPQGYYVIGNGEIFNGSEGKYIINKLDLTHGFNHPDPARLAGCCGFGGHFGPNKVCRNGHEIATEYSDCLLPHAVVLEKETVKIFSLV